MKLKLKLQECTEANMQRLETSGAITRLMPGRHVLSVDHETSRHETLYASEKKFGPHKLICVTINKTTYDNFLYHNDNEEFMLIDTTDATELLMLIALVDQTTLKDKIEKKTLTDSDFIFMKMAKNDPEKSFFTMNKGYAHVEMCLEASDVPPSFYVTESRDIDEQFIDFKDYDLELESV